MRLARRLVEDLQTAHCGDPFAVLGVHRTGDGIWARIWQREATAVRLIPRDGSAPVDLQRTADGLFEAPIPGRRDPFPYELEVTRSWSAPGQVDKIRDPYSFWLQLSEWDLERFREGAHHDVEKVLGARCTTVDGCRGVLFAVWAPAAVRVSVVGDWNGFDGRWHPMRLRHPFGVWEMFIPGLAAGDRYKFEILGQDGRIRVKADPLARACELPPATASIVSDDTPFAWNDAAWMKERRAGEWRRKPMSIYEIHAGSWRRGPDGARLSWRELGPQLVAHCKELGFTHVEFLPLAAHPFEGSWGYQVTGQYAPDARGGSPQDLRWLIDQLHAAGIGVIVDFVPGHFPKDDFSLARFDGHPLYEYADPREGEHRTWGTLVYNWRRPEVRNFLVGAALHWLRSYHIDGIRVDAVSSMLYRDYDREDGQWVANEEGGNANREAVEFLREMNARIHELFPGVVTIAEESTAWKGVTAAVEAGGLGFDLKWNMGWMHDTLRYLALDPVHRRANHDVITFHQWYAYDDAWVLPLSHDEVVHGKGSLLNRLHGDYPERLAQLRLLLAWQIAVPGRPLLFMGGEWGQGREWDWQRGLDWSEAEQPERRGLRPLLARLLTLYRQRPALHAADDARDGFAWVMVEDRDASVLAFRRQAPGGKPVVAVCNFTPVPRSGYRLSTGTGSWTVLVNTDSIAWGGAGRGAAEGTVLPTGPDGALLIDLPPLAAVLLG